MPHFGPIRRKDLIALLKKTIKDRLRAAGNREPVKAGRNYWPFTQKVIAALESTKLTDDERRLIELVESGEQAYDDMYGGGHDLDMCYISTKEDLYNACFLAGEMGRKDLEELIYARLQHIKGIFRAQFAR